LPGFINNYNKLKSKRDEFLKLKKNYKDIIDQNYAGIDSKSTIEAKDA
jgi:hypothetical protein